MAVLSNEVKNYMSLYEQVRPWWHKLHGDWWESSARFEPQSFFTQVFLDNIHKNVFSSFQDSWLNPVIYGRPLRVMSKLLRKFRIGVFNSSSDGFYLLDVTINVKRTFLQLLSVENIEQMNLDARFLPFQLVLECLRDIQDSQVIWSNVLLDWIKNTDKLPSYLSNLVSIPFFPWEGEFPKSSWSLDQGHGCNSKCLWPLGRRTSQWSVSTCIQGRGCHSL